jgi:maltodextrin utilization protein YvdJ
LENLQTRTNDNQTLKSIPVNVPPFGLILYNNNENIETLIKNSQIDNLNIEIVDDDDNLINFNNQDWTICIELKTTLQVSYNTQTIDEYLNQN